MDPERESRVDRIFILLIVLGIIFACIGGYYTRKCFDLICDIYHEKSVSESCSEDDLETMQYDDFDSDSLEK